MLNARQDPALWTTHTISEEFVLVLVEQVYASLDRGLECFQKQGRGRCGPRKDGRDQMKSGNMVIPR